ncbi:DUF47 family protein [Pelotomaculum terephthalicicum JT]|uniref:DUF47 domain-containing protein n=1 Tax=Pelotomaculum TaxID=191373 RepID=UPI0009CFED59|nr:MULTISPECIES: DUF47 family protein [Pelotomaculum]MCG9967096.1 DUF47 family protein [Pelotomaculum terephthalicicum JT]OPX87806.1 MAG: hypothetical protein A4E54_01513 [Pelotomaculum sp. PtaB.Bin117]OPY63858.1 MAG: hypothetical protein A4E56_00208 [Pelotomaculum sp. PtaU1.Bin065]
MGKKSFLDRLFPAKYDFYGMLREQAEVTARGVKTMLAWLEAPSTEKFDLVINLTLQADTIRMDMEEKLIEAFTTPFDRQDIYYISVRMDRIIEHARIALQSIKEYDVQPDELIVKMVRELSEGTYTFAQAVALLESDPIQARNQIQMIRNAHKAVEDYYQKGMAAIFKTADAINAIKHYEINCQLRDAANYLSHSVDILHRIVVRLV